MVHCKVSVNFQSKPMPYSQIVAIDAAVPQPAAVEIDAHVFVEPERRRDHGKGRAVFAGQGVEGAAGVNGVTEPSDAGRCDVRLGFRLDRGAPLAVAARAVGEHAQFDRLERVDHAGRIGHGRKIGVGRGRQPALDLARSGFGNVGGIDRIGAVGRPRLSGRKPGQNGRRDRYCRAPCPDPHRQMLAESLPRHSPDFAPILTP